MYFPFRVMSVALRNTFAAEVSGIARDGEVIKVEAALCKYSKQGLDETAMCTIHTDLPASNYTDYTRHVTGSMGLHADNKDHLLNAWESVKFGGVMMKMIKQKANHGGFKFVCVILAAVKKSDNTYDLAFATHTLTMGVGVINANSH